MSINKYESAVRSCFGKDDIESIWYGGTEGKIGDNPNKMYLAITGGPEWFFDFDKFKNLPLLLDYVSYRVCVIWEKGEKPEYDLLSEFC